MGGSDSNDSRGEARRENCFDAWSVCYEQQARTASKYTEEEDLIILREEAATKAQIALYGKTSELFQTAAEKVNGNAKFTVGAKAKGILGRYIRLQKDFDKNKRKNACCLVLVGR